MVAGGARRARRQTGVAERVQACYQSGRPPKPCPPPHRREDSTRERGRPARILIPFGRTAILEGQRSATTGEGVASTPRATIKRIIHIDAQDTQDFSRIRPAFSPEHPQARTGSTPEPALVHKPFVLSILCILCIHVQKMSIPCAVAGPSGWSRWPRQCHRLVRAGRPRSRVDFIP